MFALRGRMIQVGELWSEHLILGMVVATGNVSCLVLPSHNWRWDNAIEIILAV